MMQPSTRQAQQARTPAPRGTPVGTKLLPFDQVVTLPLTGQPHNVVRAVTNISTVGTFVATAISYSLLAEAPYFRPEIPDPPPVVVRAERPNAVIPPSPQMTVKAAFGADTARQNTTGELVLRGTPGTTIAVDVMQGGASFRTIPKSGRVTIKKPFETVDPYQKATLAMKAPINSLTEVWIEMTDQAEQKPHRVTIFDDSPPAVGRKGFSISGPPGETVFVTTDPSVAGLDIERQKHLTIDGKPYVEVELSEDGKADVQLEKALPLGGTIVISDQDPSQPPQGPILQTTVTLHNNLLALNLAAIPPDRLAQGFRIRPQIMRRLLRGVPIPTAELADPFERCGVCDLHFLYTITDLGSGRELQNEPIHNLAGLGTADGDRPFRIFPQPIVFRPRSVIEFEVREISGGPGTLYFVLQGYKVLGPSRRSQEV